MGVAVQLADAAHASRAPAGENRKRIPACLRVPQAPPRPRRTRAAQRCTAQANASLQCQFPARPQLVYTVAAAVATQGPSPPAQGPSQEAQLALMLGWIACVLSGALAAALLAAVPALGAIKKAADELAALAAAIKDEVPDTAATVRLSGLELSDTIEEFGHLGADIGDGLRSSARAVAAAEAGVRLLGATVQRDALPAAKKRLAPLIKQAAAKGEELLEERAVLEEYSGPAIAAAAERTRVGVARARQVLKAADVGRKVQGIVKNVKSALDHKDGPSPPPPSSGVGSV